MPQIFSVVRCMVARNRHAVCSSPHRFMHPFTHVIHLTCTLFAHVFSSGAGGGGGLLFVLRRSCLTTGSSSL